MGKAYLIAFGWLALAFFVVVPGASAQAEIEYVGHASFVVASPSGLRIVIDPFNSNRWLGYRYPEDLAADAVLVTHPHYDHDASYYWGDDVPVFREPGRYRVGDVELLGVEGRHADPYGRDFGQINTIWIVEAGGVRIAHLGDNGPLTERSVRRMGRVDVVLVPVDDQEHILKFAEIEAIREGLDSPVVVPMHYRLEGFLDLPVSLGPLDAWLEGREDVERLDTNRRTFLPGERGNVVVFRPSPELRSWSDELARGWKYLDEAQERMRDDPGATDAAGALVEKAFHSADCVVFGFHWGRMLAEGGRTADAVAVLEASLARAARDDLEYRMRSHALLGEIYDELGDRERARRHHRVVLTGSYRLELREAAERALSRR